MQGRLRGLQSMFTLGAQTACGGSDLKLRALVAGMEKQMDEPAFKQVSRESFEETYFRLGGGELSGWTAGYWREVIEPVAGPGWRFLVEEPRSAAHTRMWVVSDPRAMEHRLFFRTEQSEEDFFDRPGDE